MSTRGIAPWNKGRGGVIIHCSICGKPRRVSPSTAKTTKFCSRTCRYTVGYWRGKKRPGIGEKLRQRTKGRHLNPRTEFRKGHIPWNKGKTKDTDLILIKLSRKAQVRMKERWTDPKYRDEFLRKIHGEPNGLERRFLRFILKYELPFRFNDGPSPVLVAGRRPDFVSTEEPLRVIELFGSWWHNKHKNPKAKTYYLPHAVKTHYKRAGIPCIYIWDGQLKDETILLKFIWRFCANTAGNSPF